MANYMQATDIQKAMKDSVYTQLTSDADAITFAVDTTNNEMKSILHEEYAEIADVPSNIRQYGAIIGRYWLHSFHGIIDKTHSFYVDYQNAIAMLKLIASGEAAGLGDPDASDDDKAIRYQSEDRQFDRDQWL